MNSCPSAVLYVVLLMQIVTNLYVNETYVLYQCGTARPSTDLVPAGSKFFEIPLTSVTVLETIPYAYLVSPAWPLITSDCFFLQCAVF